MASRYILHPMCRLFSFRLMRSKRFDISLSHPSPILALRGEDVPNIDRVLSLAIAKQGSPDSLRELLQNTAMKYLKRLQEDGLISDPAGPTVVPIYDPHVTERALEFHRWGGYARLLATDPPRRSRFSQLLHNPTIAGILATVIGGIIVALVTSWNQSSEADLDPLPAASSGANIGTDKNENYEAPSTGTVDAESPLRT